MLLDVYKDGQYLGRMNPAVVAFKASGDQTDHKVAIRHAPLEDLYVIYAGKNPDNGHPIVKAFVNPMVSWVWYGVMAMILGTGLALVPNAVAVKAALPAAVTVPAFEKHGMHPAGAGK